MFQDRKVNNEINTTHEGALRIVFKGTSSNFEESLNAAGYSCKLQLLTIQMCETKNDLNPKFKVEVFNERNIQDRLRGNDSF